MLSVGSMPHRRARLSMKITSALLFVSCARNDSKLNELSSPESIEKFSGFMLSERRATLIERRSRPPLQYRKVDGWVVLPRTGVPCDQSAIKRNRNRVRPDAAGPHIICRRPLSNRLSMIHSISPGSMSSERVMLVDVIVVCCVSCSLLRRCLCIICLLTSCHPARTSSAVGIKNLHEC